MELALIIGGSVLAALLLIAFAVWAHQYAKVGPNEVLVISGLAGPKGAAHAGASNIIGVDPVVDQRIAVRQQQNLRALNVYTDSDDIVRRLPLTFTVDGKPVPSMALELASLTFRDLVCLAEGADDAVLARDRLPALAADARSRDPRRLRTAAERCEETRESLELNVTEDLALQALTFRLRRLVGSGG